MRDIKVNLLPWRDERREQKKKEFLNVLVGVLVFAGVIIFGIDRYYNGEIETQKSRNNFLTKEFPRFDLRVPGYSWSGNCSGSSMSRSHRCNSDQYQK